MIRNFKRTALLTSLLVIAGVTAGTIITLASSSCSGGKKPTWQWKWDNYAELTNKNLLSHEKLTLPGTVGKEWIDDNFEVNDFINILIYSTQERLTEEFSPSGYTSSGSIAYYASKNNNVFSFLISTKIKSTGADKTNFTASYGSIKGMDVSFQQGGTTQDNCLFYIYYDESMRRDVTFDYIKGTLETGQVVSEETTSAFDAGSLPLDYFN